MKSKQPNYLLAEVKELCVDWTSGQSSSPSVALEDNTVRTVASKIQFMRDEQGQQEIFRYDYERDTSNHYPAAHLHVYGSLPDKFELPGLSETGKTKSLHHIHFPVIRPTLESVIRLLINDYGIQANVDATIWEPVLDYTEREFFRIFTPQRSANAHPQFKSH